MTEPHPTTEAEGATVANIGNPPREDKGAICDTEKKEGEEKMDVDENKETKEKEDICGNDEGEDKKDVKEKDGEVQEDREEKKEGEAEEDGEKNMEGEAEEDGEENKEGEVKGNGDEKNEGEVKENGGEKKEGKETNDVEEKEDGQQNGLTKLENVDGVKEDTDNVNTAEAEDVKMVEVMDDDAEDVKMVDAKDVKDEEKGGKTGEQEETSENKAENDVNREGDDGTTEEKADEDEEADGSKRKRPRAKKASQKGEGKGKKGGVTKAKELLGSPVSSIERPVRERKTVERLVEVIEKEPNREFQVEKGRGTPLKDIPNVAYKLARKKPADIKLIHQTLFGRKGKAINFKSHILQFSGFVWHESDEKQRAKMKEKLDKYVKDTLLDLCDLFDLPVSRANSRKEDLVAKLLDFLVAPHPTTDVLPEKDQEKSRKRKRMAREGASKSRGVVPAKHGKKGTRSQETAIEKESSAQETEDDDEEDEKEEDLSEGEKVHKHSESEAKETESGESADEDEDDKEDEYNEKVGKGRQDKKKSIKQRGAAAKEKFKVATSPKKSSLPTITKSPAKRSYSKSSKAEEDNDKSIKVFTSKKRNTDSPKKKSTPKSNTKEKTTDKKTSRGKTKPLEVEQPSKGELRKKICEILKEVDFNTATFTDILKQLAAYYKMDLTPRKASLKLMIQEELTKLAEEAEEEEEDEDDDDDPEKEEKPEPKGKEVEA